MQRFTWMGVAVALVFTSGVSGNVFIDTFDNGSHTAQYTGAAAGSSAPNLASGFWAQNPIGNDRQITATRTNSSGDPLSVTIDVLAGAGHTHLINDTGASATWMIEYGSTADLNLNLSPESLFELIFDTIDTPVSTQVIIKTTGSGTSSSGAFFTPITGILDIPFSEFDGGNAVLGDVDSITFLFDSNGTAARNAFLTQIQAVPEPGGVCLTTMFALAIAARRKR